MEIAVVHSLFVFLIFFDIIIIVVVVVEWGVFLLDLASATIGGGDGGGSSEVACLSKADKNQSGSLYGHPDGKVGGYGEIGQFESVNL